MVFLPPGLLSTLSLSSFLWGQIHVHPTKPYSGLFSLRPYLPTIRGMPVLYMLPNFLWLLVMASLRREKKGAAKSSWVLAEVEIFLKPQTPCSFSSRRSPKRLSGLLWTYCILSLLFITPVLMNPLGWKLFPYWKSIPNVSWSSCCFVRASTAREGTKGRERVNPFPSAVIPQPFHLLFPLWPLNGFPLLLCSFKASDLVEADPWMNVNREIPSHLYVFTIYFYFLLMPSHFYLLILVSDLWL